MFKIDGVNIGIIICFDWIFPELSRKLAIRGADVIVDPSNLILKGLGQKAMLTRSVENRIFTITANRIGIENRDNSTINKEMNLNLRVNDNKNKIYKFTGESQITSPNMKILVKAESNKQICKSVTVDIFEAIKQTSKNKNKNKELGITESIQTLINNGNKVQSSICVEEDVNINEPMDLWETNIKLLKKLNKKNFISKKVYIGKNVSIINSIVGPNVRIGDGSVVKDSIIFSNVILNKKTVLMGSIMTEEGFVKLK